MLRISNIIFAVSSWIVLATGSGCALVPDIRHDAQVHNPFPQLQRIAVLPFFNQSSEPTLNQDQVAEAYYAELQAIPGFEVLPIGVTKLKWHEFQSRFGEPTESSAFQKFAQYLNVDAVVVGAVTDYTPYYPPRLAMTTHWYAANPGLYPIPPGYGLPWGTKAEKEIPQDVVLATEFELARQQLKSQTPQMPEYPLCSPNARSCPAPEQGQTPYSAADQPPMPPDAPSFAENDALGGGEGNWETGGDDGLPAQWPDPTGLIPDGPTNQPPRMIAQHEPVLSHTQLFRAGDADFTQQLADTFYFDDDARFGGWQAYLARSDDFIRFCCKLHITKMLESRGGKHKSDLILRWPISRYVR